MLVRVTLGPLRFLSALHSPTCLVDTICCTAHRSLRNIHPHLCSGQCDCLDRTRRCVAESVETAKIFPLHYGDSSSCGIPCLHIYPTYHNTFAVLLDIRHSPVRRDRSRVLFAGVQHFVSFPLRALPLFEQGKLIHCLHRATTDSLYSLWDQADSYILSQYQDAWSSLTTPGLYDNILYDTVLADLSVPMYEYAVNATQANVTCGYIPNATATQISDHVNIEATYSTYHFAFSASLPTSNATNSLNETTPGTIQDSRCPDVHSVWVRGWRKRYTSNNPVCECMALRRHWSTNPQLDPVYSEGDALRLFTCCISD